MNDEKQCSKCRQMLPLSEFHRDRDKKDGLHTQCKECRILMGRECRKKPENKRYISKYGKEYYIKNKKYRKEYLQKNKEQIKKYREEYGKDYYIKNKEYKLKWQREYFKTENGRIVAARHNAKRQRELGFNLLYENILDEKFNYHHINDKDVVALPTDIHTLYLGKYHREKLDYIVKQIYGEE